MNAQAYLLGLSVQRSKPARRRHIVWSGFTEAARADHADFIRQRCHDPEVDGELVLEPVQSPIVIDGPGLYVGPNLPAGVFAVRIDAVKADGTCYGYQMVRGRSGKLRATRATWHYVNGLPTNPASAITLTERAKAFATGLVAEEA